MALSVEEIWALKTRMEGDGAALQTRYHELFQAYGGDHLTRQRYGINLLSPIRPARSANDKPQDIDFVIRVVRPIIRAKRKFIGTMPSIRVPYPPFATDGVQAMAEKLERVYAGLWNLSYMPTLMGDIGYFCPLYGTAVLVVWPDFDNKRPTFLVESPVGFYADPEDARGLKLGRAMFVRDYTGSRLLSMYPDLAGKVSDSGDYQLVQYFDHDQLNTSVAGVGQISNVNHDLGFTPILTIPNVAIPGSHVGDSDIEDAMKLQEEINYRYQMRTEVAEQMIYQPLVVKDAQNAPEGEWDLSPNSVIEVGAQGGVTRVPPVNISYDYFKDTEDFMNLINLASDAPDIIRSQYNASVVTGKAVNAVMAPALAGLQLQLDGYVYPALQEANKMAMRMWKKMWGRKEHWVYGERDGSPFTEKFRLSEFGGWYENEVYLPDSAYYDKQSEFVMLLQALQNRLISRKTARRYVPWVRDPAEEDAQVKAEYEEELRQAQQQAQMVQANQQPFLSEPGLTNYQLEKGYIGETQAPPNPPGVAPMGGAPPMGGPAEGAPPNERGLLQILVDELRSVPKVKGSVYLAGGILQGEADATVYFSDGLDKATVSNYLKNNIPEIHGRLRFEVGMPSEAYVVVIENGQPAQGYDIVGPNAAAEQLLTPELMGAGAMQEGVMPSGQFGV